MRRCWGSILGILDPPGKIRRFAKPIPHGFQGRTGSDEEVLKTVRGIVESGAAGIFFGRNIFQADNMPDRLQRARSILAGNGLRKDHDL